MYSIKIPELKLNLRNIVNYSEEMTLLFQGETFQIKFSPHIKKEDYLILKADFQTLLQCLFPNLKLQLSDNNNDSNVEDRLLSFNATKELMRLVEQTFRNCGFAKRISKSEQDLPHEQVRDRLNTFFGSRKPAPTLAPALYSSPFVAKRSSSIVVMPVIADENNNNMQFGNTG